MSKTIVTVDKELINYDNIVSVSVEQGDYLYENENIYNDVYGLIARDVGNQIHILGVYKDEESADKAKNKLKEWLECELFGVYDLTEFKGDD